MYIEAVPNRNSPPAILLRESYRENGKVRKRTLCNLSDWPTAHVEGLRGVLKGGTVIPADRDAFTILRSLPHGHVAAALGTARKIGLDRLLGPGSDRCRDLALLIGRILEPTSKLAAARARSPATASSSLGEALGLGEVDDDELYAALDWLHQRQPAIETILANRHLRTGTLVLYDVSSSYLEGRCCPLAQRGYSRDGKPGSLQIVYGLLCAPDGCPVAIEVFTGNTADPMTLAPQIAKLKQRFGLEHVVLAHLIHRLCGRNICRALGAMIRGASFIARQERTGQALAVGGRWRARGTNPVRQGPAGRQPRTRAANRSASGQAAVKAMRTRVAVSVIHVPILIRCSRRVANSAVARGCGLGMASRTHNSRQ